MDRQPKKEFEPSWVDLYNRFWGRNNGVAEGSEPTEGSRMNLGFGRSNANIGLDIFNPHVRAVGTQLSGLDPLTQEIEFVGTGGGSGAISTIIVYKNNQRRIY